MADEFQPKRFRIETATIPELEDTLNRMYTDGYKEYKRTKVVTDTGTVFVVEFELDAELFVDPRQQRLFGQHSGATTRKLNTE